MAFSSSYNYTESYTAASLIARALKRIGIMDASESVNATEESDALEVLNLIVKEWVTNGVNIWSRSDLFLFLTDYDTNVYRYGTGLRTNLTLAHRTTQLSVAASATDGTIDVDSIANIADTNHILIALDNNKLHETTVNGAPAGSTITLTDAMPSAAAVDSYVYTYATTSAVSSTLVDVLTAQRLTTTSDTLSATPTGVGGIYTPMRIIGHEEYQQLSDKLQEGAPTSLFFQRSRSQTNVFVWPTGNVKNLHRLRLTCNLRFQDLDATTNNLDVPPEGVNPLCWQLAAELASEYGLSEVEQRRLWSIANRKVDNFFDFSVEEADVSFSLDYPQNR